MKEIIELLSLSKGEKGQGRGRISYAQLGISQLGAVYESLLSFSGFFATEDLVELKPAGEPAPGPLKAAFFTPKRRAGDFVSGATPLEGEFVYDGTAPRTYPKGTFIYRLSGRNRENSASYYTPEPLARVLVKYALKELLVGKKADDILNLKVVEPAMGSAAFLVEVVNQLTDRYLELKQAEVGKRIPHETFAYERQRVRAYLADRNVFGVDLNPIAVELGQVSLWLNCLHAGGFAPWFEDQVQTGNSLVGARRAAFPASCLMARREDERWYKTKPREIGWSGAKRASDEVWHFLLPDPGMCAYDVNIVRPLAPDDWKTITEWRRDFTGPFTVEEVTTVRRLSQAVDALFDQVADRLEEMRVEVNDEIAIWPQAAKFDERHVDFSDKMVRFATFHGDGASNSVAWRRLKATMDAWCALWFWPIDKADLLPSRSKFFQDMDLLLTQGIGNQTVEVSAFATGPSQGRLFEAVPSAAGARLGLTSSGEARVVEINRSSLFEEVDVEKLIQASPWLPTAMKIAARQRFMHFDLEFADVMRERGGFDLIIGNPPWLKPSWSDPDVLSEYEPAFGIRDVSSADVGQARSEVFARNIGLKEIYLGDYVQVAGMQTFTSALSCYPHVSQGQPNLYKCFIDLSLRICSRLGIAALIHPDGHLTDPNGAALRSFWYKRIIKHFNFSNAITKRMFAEVSHRRTFSLNVYAGCEKVIGFDHSATLLLPSMVDESYEHDGVGSVPGLKQTDGEWNTHGHRKRIVYIDSQVLKAFASVIEEGGTSPENSRFLFPYSEDTLAVFKAFGLAQVPFSRGAQPYDMSGCLHEGGATKGSDPLIVLQRCTPHQVNHLILTGSMIFVGNPFYKCASPAGRDVEIDSSSVGVDYLPPAYYSRATNDARFDAALPRLSWSANTLHTQCYRIAFRKMMSTPTERTLIAALITPGPAHIDGIVSIAFSENKKLINAYPFWISLPFDFIVKATGLVNLYESSLRSFPWAEVSSTAKHRALRLACLTEQYAEIWNEHALDLRPQPWSSTDARLYVEEPHDSACLATWNRKVALRSDFARRQALVEIDVLVAQALGLTLEQLIEMYRTQFHVLEENERGTWYDKSGRIVWTCSKGLSGVGWRKKDGKKPSGREWDEFYADLPEGEKLECDLTIDFLPSGPQKIHRTYDAPFITCDREADYRRAWAFFAALEQKKVA